jgi:hypothetical protein
LLLGVTDDHPLLVGITYLINLLFGGHMLTPIHGMLFWAVSWSLQIKKTGGIWAINVGYVWRRLAAKVACYYIIVASAALLAPRQLGFSVTRGAESAIRAGGLYVDNMQQSQPFLKIDFRSALQRNNP